MSVCVCVCVCVCVRMHAHTRAPTHTDWFCMQAPAAELFRKLNSELKPHCFCLPAPGAIGHAVSLP